MLRLTFFINQETFCSKSFYTENKLAYFRSGLFCFLHCFLVQVTILKFHLSNIYPVCMQALKYIHLEFYLFSTKILYSESYAKNMDLTFGNFLWRWSYKFFFKNNYFLNSSITKLLEKHRTFNNLVNFCWWHKYFWFIKIKLPRNFLYVCFFSWEIN